MGEINFLANNQPASNQDQKPEQKKKDESAIEWSKPAADDKRAEKTSFHWLDFFNIKKNKKADTGAKEKRKIKHSRREILELIKQAPPQQEGSIRASQPEVKSKKHNWQDQFRELINKIIKKKVSHKDLLIDYQQVFQEEKEKKGAFIPKMFSAPPKPEQAKQPIVIPKSPEPVKQAVTPLVKQSEPKPQKVEPADKEWQNPKLVETNLIKSEIVTYFDWPGRIAILAGAIVLACLVIGTVYGGLLFIQKQNQAKNELLVKKFAELEVQVKQAEKNVQEITSFQRRLKLTGALLARHIYWTNFFKFLEDNTINNIYFLDFSGNTSGGYALNAMARNYNSIAQQVNFLKDNNQVKNAKSAGGKMGGQGEASGVNFVLELEIAPEIFIE